MADNFTHMSGSFKSLADAKAAATKTTAKDVATFGEKMAQATAKLRDEKRPKALTKNDKNVTLIPSAPSAKTVATDTVSSPYAIFGEYEPYFQLIKQQSEANQAKQLEYASQLNDWQAQQNKIAMDFNAAEAAKNRDWQEMMSNTAHQREIRDLQAAGLNPILSATGGNGAAVTSGATASGVTSSGSKPEVDTGALVAMLNLLNNVMGYATSTASAGINAGATLGAAQTAANASMANALLSSKTSRYNTEYSSDKQYQIHQDFPSNAWQLINALGNEVAQNTGNSSWFGAVVNGLTTLIKSAKRK